MTSDSQPTSLEQVLDLLREATHDRDEVAVRTIMETIGYRSFGPVLVVFGVLALSPISGIPGMPSTIGLLVLLVSGQLLLRRKHIWLPNWLLDRHIGRDKFVKALDFLAKPARLVDRALRPRLTALTGRAGLYVIAALSILVAASMPPLEALPFAASSAGAALAAFGLALIAHDGLWAIVAFAFTGGVAGLVVYSLM